MLKKTPEYYRELMDRAVVRGKTTQLPKWLFLVLHLRGALKWLLTFKLFGASLALEPVYGCAEASSGKVPEGVRENIIKLSRPMEEFIRYTDIGRTYGERFRQVMEKVRDCDDSVSSIVSLMSGSGMAEIVGLWLRKISRRHMPVIILVDSNRKSLGRAMRFAEELGVSDYITCREDRAECFTIPSTGRIIVMSIGGFGNYCSKEYLRSILEEVCKNEAVSSVCMDFVLPQLVEERLQYAIGWPIANSDDNFRGVHAYSPEDIEALFAVIPGFSGNVKNIVPNLMSLLELSRT